jgi:hypothetical protein
VPFSVANIQSLVRPLELRLSSNGKTILTKVSACRCTFLPE